MTPAIDVLVRAGVDFSLHEYEPSGDGRDFGREAAAALALPPDQVFKTLLVDLDGGAVSGLAVTVVPVSCRLSLKACAAAFGAKRATMADPSAAERATGYVVGGISPLGQRRRLPTLVDEAAELFDVIYVSGGRRGLDVALAPDDLLALVGGRLAAIAM